MTVNRYPLPATRHPLPVARYPLPAYRMTVNRYPLTVARDPSPQPFLVRTPSYKWVIAANPKSTDVIALADSAEGGNVAKPT